MIKIILIIALILFAILVSPIIKFMKKRKQKKEVLTTDNGKTKIKKEINPDELLALISKIYNKEILEKKSVKDYNYDDLLQIINAVYNHEITVAAAFAKFIIPIEKVD